MTSYFDEHNCEPLQDGQAPNHLLHFARLLIDGGYAREWQLEFDRLNGGLSAPPASKAAVEQLPTKLITPAQAALGKQCPICLLAFDEEDETKEMPCRHQFHPGCILPWLEKTNSCPVCRHELPTDDADYEELKKQKARQKQRDHDLEALHDSMFG